MDGSLSSLQNVINLSKRIQAQAKSWTKATKERIEWSTCCKITREQCFQANKDLLHLCAWQDYCALTTSNESCQLTALHRPSTLNGDKSNAWAPHTANDLQTEFILQIRSNVDVMGLMFDHLGSISEHPWAHLMIHAFRASLFGVSKWQKSFLNFGLKPIIRQKFRKVGNVDVSKFLDENSILTRLVLSSVRSCVTNESFVGLKPELYNLLKDDRIPRDAARLQAVVIRIVNFFVNNPFSELSHVLAATLDGFQVEGDAATRVLATVFWKVLYSPVLTEPQTFGLNALPVMDFQFANLGTVRDALHDIILSENTLDWQMVQANRFQQYFDKLLKSIREISSEDEPIERFPEPIICLSKQEFQCFYQVLFMYPLPAEVLPQLQQYQDAAGITNFPHFALLDLTPKGQLKLVDNGITGGTYLEVLKEIWSTYDKPLTPRASDETVRFRSLFSDIPVLLTRVFLAISSTDDLWAWAKISPPKESNFCGFLTHLLRKEPENLELTVWTSELLFLLRQIRDGTHGEVEDHGVLGALERCVDDIKGNMEYLEDDVSRLRQACEDYKDELVNIYRKTEEVEHSLFLTRVWFHCQFEASRFRATFSFKGANIKKSPDVHGPVRFFSDTLPDFVRRCASLCSSVSDEGFLSTALTKAYSKKLVNELGGGKAGDEAQDPFAEQVYYTLWLALEPTFQRCFTHLDAEYLNAINQLAPNIADTLEFTFTPPSKEFFQPGLFDALTFGSPDPQSRLDSLCRIVKIIASKVQLHVGRAVGADDLMPPLIWAIICCKPQTLASTLEVISRLSPSFQAIGQEGYVLVVVQQAVAIIGQMATEQTEEKKEEVV